MKSIKQLQSIIIALFFVTFLSCEKQQETIDSVDNDGANIVVNLPTVGYDAEVDLFASEANDNQMYQEETVLLSDGVTTATAELKRVNPIKNHIKDKQAATQEVKAALKAGVKYRVLVFRANGSNVANKVYTAGNEAAEGPIKLTSNLNQNYTFIVYSFNTNTDPVVPSSYNTLSSLTTLNDRTEDVMLSKTTQYIGQNTNNTLNIVLKHLFSEITTTVKLNTNMTENIYDLNNLIFSNLSAHGGTLNLNAADPTPVFPARSLNNVKNVGFVERKNKEWVSAPALLISPEAQNLRLRIPAITVSQGINEYTDGNIEFNNLVIKPKHKYNLIITINKPKSNPVPHITGTTNPFNFYYGSPDSQNPPATNAVFTYPPTSFGAVFDITKLDNSFRLIINGTPIFGTGTGDGATVGTELQFQPGGNLTQNVIFSDGSLWGANSIPHIYSLQGTRSNPVIRVVIGASGKVSMYGSKVSGGPLFPLRLRFNNATFNTVTWRTSGNTNNTIRIRQDVVTITNIGGYVSAYSLTP